MIFDASDRLDLEALHVQALELALRRAGFPTLLLSFGLPPERAARAIRAVTPSAFVFAGGDATLEVVGRLMYAVKQVGSSAPVLEYRESMPVKGERSVPSLGNAPADAVERLRGLLDDDQPLTKHRPAAAAESEPGQIVRSHA